MSNAVVFGQDLQECSVCKWVISFRNKSAKFVAETSNYYYSFVHEMSVSNRRKFMPGINMFWGQYKSARSLARGLWNRLHTWCLVGFTWLVTAAKELASGSSENITLRLAVYQKSCLAYLSQTCASGKAESQRVESLLSGTQSLTFLHSRPSTFLVQTCAIPAIFDM